jgi:hypothetical protein
MRSRDWCRSPLTSPDESRVRDTYDHCQFSALSDHDTSLLSEPSLRVGQAQRKEETLLATWTGHRPRDPHGDWWRFRDPQGNWWRFTPDDSVLDDQRSRPLRLRRLPHSTRPAPREIVFGSRRI